MLSNISAELPTDFGQFRIYSYPSEDLYFPHVVLVHEDLNISAPVPVRVHSECITGDVFGSKRCDCGYQLKTSLHFLAEHSGMLIYLRQEGRGIGLKNKIEAYALQDRGMDTIEANHQLGFEADLRNYEIAVQILREWQINKVKLLSNNPEKKKYLLNHGFDIVEMIPILKPFDDYNRKYLETKRDRMGHLIPDFQY